MTENLSLLSDDPYAAMSDAELIENARSTAGHWCCDSCAEKHMERISVRLEQMGVYADCLARGLSDAEARGTAWPDGTH